MNHSIDKTLYGDSDIKNLNDEQVVNEYTHKSPKNHDLKPFKKKIATINL